MSVRHRLFRPPRSRHRPDRAIFLALTLLAVAGCDSLTETHLEQYLETLTDLSNQPREMVVHNTTSLIGYPSHRHRQLPMPALRIGLGEFFNFYGCRLFFLINQRNSIMGKVMPISQRLAYEIRFLQAAHDCLDNLKKDASSGDAAAVEQLENIIADKQAAFSSVFWNATFDSPEMASAFSLAVTPITLDDDDSFQESRQALEYFLALGQQLDGPGVTLDSGAMESHYQALRGGKYGGRLITTLALIIDHLGVATLILVEATRNCGASSGNTTQWRTLSERLPPIRQLLSKLETQGQQWLELIDRLISLPNIKLPPVFQDYRAQMLDLNGGIWQHFQTSILQHREVQQRWLRTCVPPDLHPQLQL